MKEGGPYPQSKQKNQDAPNSLNAQTVERHNGAHGLSFTFVASVRVTLSLRASGVCGSLQKLLGLYLRVGSGQKFPALEKEGLGVVSPGLAEKSPFEGGRGMSIVHGKRPLLSLCLTIGNYRHPSLDKQERKFEACERSSDGKGWLDPVYDNKSCKSLNPVNSDSDKQKSAPPLQKRRFSYQ
jgi:hypothetical protein